MYKEHWRLTEKPFEGTPDPRFFYRSEEHEEAFSRLLYGIESGKGALMLSGVFGCGKTLVARSLFHELSSSIYRLAFVTNPVMDSVDLLRFIAHKLESPTMPERKADVLVALNHILTNNHRDGRRTIVAIDEAHAITDPAVFEEVRLLLNFQTNDRFLLTILLLGQPELIHIVGNNKQLSQRIDISYNLGPLALEETRAYIRHRLQVAGRTEPIFTDGAIDYIYSNSGGIPRRINQICDMSLLAGFFRKNDSVDEALVEEALTSFTNR